MTEEVWVRGRHAGRTLPHHLLPPVVVAVAGLLLLVSSLLQLAPGLDVWRQALATSTVVGLGTEGSEPAGTASNADGAVAPIVTIGPPSDRQTTSPVADAISPGPHASTHATGLAASSQGAAPAPTSVSIPRIRVQTELIKLGLNADRSLQVPRSYSTAGWYTEGGAPGDVAPAVIVGHYDSTNGPAVFYRLAELLPQDAIQVHRADGSVATFIVDRVEQFSKSSFPTDDVYGTVTRPELRLITCGGSFDYSTRHYRDNHVVFAHML